MPTPLRAPQTQPRPDFDPAFRDRLGDLFRWRRDVRRFRADLVAPALLDSLLADAALAPSAGYSQPGRFVSVETAARRQAVVENFRRGNQRALGAFEGERAKLYASLRLAGLEEAPVHLAAFCEEGTATGQGLGVGWVSILDPDEVRRTLDVPADLSLVANLCVGTPEAEQAEPELARAGWEQRQDPATAILRR